MSNWRDDLEDGIVALIQAADSGRAFASVVAAGQLSEADLTEAGVLAEPWCLVQYGGSDGTDNGGDVVECTAEMDVFVASVGNFAGLSERKASCFALLKLAMSALMGKVCTLGAAPAVWVSEAGIGIDPETGLETWRQVWRVRITLGKE